MADLLSTALAFAGSGWPVFPLRPNGKTPVIGSAHPDDPDLQRTCRRACGRDGHGVHDATTDANRVVTWWQKWQNANIGLACGLPGPDVVDIDVHEGKPGMENMRRLIHAGLLVGAHAVVRTPSGGLHLYYAGSTGQACGARTRHGVDFRTGGGYVVAAGSVVDGTAYAVEDRQPRERAGVVDWQAILTYLDPPRPAQPRIDPRFGDPTSPLARWAAQKFDELVREYVDQGGRSERFHDLVGLARKAGMSESQAVAAIDPWCEMTGKFRGRVEREVSRSWGKKAGAAA